MNETYLYPYSAKEARERNELSLWRESHRANIACRGAIEDAIRREAELLSTLGLVSYARSGEKSSLMPYKKVLLGGR